MLPTYMRSSTLLPTFVDSAIEMATNTDNICFSFCVNKNDHGTIEYIKKRFKDTSIEYTMIIENEQNPNLAVFFNMIYNATHADNLIMSMLGDDMQFVTRGYDLLILEKINNIDGLGIVYGDDCLWWHEKLCVNFFTTCKFVDLIKPNKFMCEAFPRDQIDIIWYEIAKKLSMLYYIGCLKIKHNHSTAPGNSLDETYKRLFKEDNIRKENLKHTDEIVRSCVACFKTNIVEKRYENNIAVLMTTCDRINLLEKTVASYNEAIIKPDEIHVFDDCSSDRVLVNKIVSSMKGVVIHNNTEKKGCGGNTPYAIRYMFENTKYETVIVVDSDVIFDNMWWVKVNKFFGIVSGMDDFGSINMINLDNNPKGVPTQFQGLLTKTHWGACGAVITKDFWEKYIVPIEAKYKSLWDNKSSGLCGLDKKKNYICSPSLIQHTGINQGTNLSVSGKGCYAVDFGTNVFSSKEFSINKGSHNEKILFSMQGRYGDIVMGSSIVNMLLELGYKVDVLTIPYYQDFVTMMTNGNAKKIIKHTHLIYKMFDWGDSDTESMAQEYPGYEFYINGQPGSRENHDVLLRSGLHIAMFIKSRVEDILGISLPNNLIDYMPSKRDETIKNRPYCLISPEAISINSLINEAKVDELYEKYSVDYDVRAIVRSRPELPFCRIKDRYIYGMEIAQCIKEVMRADLLISNDSGLAWIAMMNRECKKIIYHRKERLLQTNCWYNAIDPNATDMVVE